MFGTFKGMNTTLAKKVAQSIKKEDFLSQCKQAWYPLIKINSSTEDEVTAVLSRIKKSGFKEVFNIVGITEEDLKPLIEEIKNEKASAAGIERK